jgi:hypothetical protein
MRAQDHNLNEETLRPKGSRLTDTGEADSHLFEAAAAGRPDVLGPEGMLRLQRAVGNAGAATLAEQRSPVLDVIEDGGQSLDEPVRTDMEARLGADFSDVRVHSGDHAHDSAQSVGARAYTVGSNIVFQRDAYDPSSAEGKTTLAHELTHVVQQRSGPVDGTPSGDGVSVSDPGDRFERAAAENAERVMAESSAPGTASAEGAAPAAASVQRDEGEEPDESLQGLFVQREDTDEEQLAD